MNDREALDEIARVLNDSRTDGFSAFAEVRRIVAEVRNVKQ